MIVGTTGSSIRLPLERFCTGLKSGTHSAIARSMRKWDNVSGKRNKRGIRVVVWKAKARMKDDLSKARVVEFEGTGTYKECFGSRPARSEAIVATAGGQPVPGNRCRTAVKEIIRISSELYLSATR